MTHTSCSYRIHSNYFAESASVVNFVSSFHKSRFLPRTHSNRHTFAYGIVQDAGETNSPRLERSITCYPINYLFLQQKHKKASLRRAANGFPAQHGRQASRSERECGGRWREPQPNGTNDGARQINQRRVECTVLLLPRDAMRLSCVGRRLLVDTMVCLAES